MVVLRNSAGSEIIWFCYSSVGSEVDEEFTLDTQALHRWDRRYLTEGRVVWEVACSFPCLLCFNAFLTNTLKDLKGFPKPDSSFLRGLGPGMSYTSHKNVTFFQGGFENLFESFFPEFDTLSPFNNLTSGIQITRLSIRASWLQLGMLICKSPDVGLVFLSVDIKDFVETELVISL